MDSMQQEGIGDPSETDVLLGRGGWTQKHAGNQTFRHLVALNKGLYATCLKCEKPKIANSIVSAIREAGGRFLEKDKETGLWNEAGDDRAIEKTSQALREGQSKLRKMIQEAQASLGGSNSSASTNTSLGLQNSMQSESNKPNITSSATSAAAVTNSTTSAAAVTNSTTSAGHISQVTGSQVTGPPPSAVLSGAKLDSVFEAEPPNGTKHTQAKNVVISEEVKHVEWDDFDVEPIPVEAFEPLHGPQKRRGSLESRRSSLHSSVALMRQMYGSDHSLKPQVSAQSVVSDLTMGSFVSRGSRIGLGGSFVDPGNFDEASSLEAMFLDFLPETVCHAQTFDVVPEDTEAGEKKRQVKRRSSIGTEFAFRESNRSLLSTFSKIGDSEHSLMSIAASIRCGSISSNSKNRSSLSSSSTGSKMARRATQLHEANIMSELPVDLDSVPSADETSIGGFSNLSKFSLPSSRSAKSDISAIHEWHRSLADPV